jgi:hypothetical protein
VLADVTRTNIFMSRLNGGLQAELLGQHVDLEAQRQLLNLRREYGSKTQLIVASLHHWETFVQTAGCDVYTAPAEVLQNLMSQTEVPPDGVESKLETSYESELEIASEVLDRLPRERIARLWEVEPELIEFLVDYRKSDELDRTGDGDALYRRFDKEGFGDVFYAPSGAEWSKIRSDKLPDLDSDLTKSLPIDTHYSLLADGDFMNYQDEMDEKLLQL